MGLIAEDPKTYANILSDGSIRVKTQETDPLAVKREYETSDGKKGVKFEKVYKKLLGHIRGITFYEGDFGKTLQITINDGSDDDITLTTSMNNNFATDIMKKLPNVDLKKEVLLVPFSFEDKNKKTRKGITVYQDGEKIKDFFHDEKNKPLNGYPPLTKDIKDYDSEDWKVYFIEARKFLQKYIESNILPKLSSLPPVENSKISNDDFPEPQVPNFGEDDKEVEEISKSFNEENVKEEKEDEVPFESPFEEIMKLAKEKYKVETEEEVKTKVMEDTQLAFIKINYTKILKALKDPF